MRQIKDQLADFPAQLFILYAVLYAVQAVYGGYLNLYLSDIGFSKTQIGLIVSLSTAVLLLFQPLWGMISDRSRSKNTMLKVLYAASAVAALLFYTTTVYWQLLGIIILFSMFYFPIIPLQDNHGLEYLEDKRWDFGKVRMGGTLGYAVAVIITGLLLKDDYSKIFIAISVLLLLCLIAVFLIPSVPGHHTERQTRRGLPLRDIFKNPLMICLMVFFIVFALGFNLYYSFYPIHFSSVGGTSRQIGTMLFVSAISEIPFLLTARYWLRRFGIEKVLIASGLISSLRWLLLFFLEAPVLIILVNCLHGLGYVTVNFSIISFINTNLPRQLRATGQTICAVLVMFFSRVIFGYIGGIASDFFGVSQMMLFSAVITIIITFVFMIWFSWLKKRTVYIPLQESARAE
ncbi:MAG: MFS transporter [Eubacteriales bacterium]|nr:MFS transporter [Eubacteriales bacterium]